MSAVQQCVQFLEDLILGDFNENQMLSAQLIGGLISLVPIVDQVMDVRDVSGTLYRINKHGGFTKASLDDKVNFGFAAFGVVPEIGSAFKTIFKPLYKERKAAKGVINGGVAMVERMLGMQKGGAVKWVRALDWAGNTQAAILQADMALEQSIELLEYLAQPHWWCPEHLQQTALDVAPGIKSLRGKLAGPISEASTEIRLFTEAMLGEHAAAVALAVVGNSPTARGHEHPPHAAHGGKSSEHHTKHKDIEGAPRTQGKTGQARIAAVTQKVAYSTYTALDFAVKGLMGEHIVEHHVIESKGWGLDWNGHDIAGAVRGGRTPGWQNAHVKINDGGIPTYLCTPSAKILSGGIDSLWRTNRQRPHEFAVVEAKAHMNPNVSLYQLLGEANAANHGSGGITRTSRKVKRRRTGSTIPESERSSSCTAGAAKGQVMQMSRRWIDDRVKRSFVMLKGEIIENYSRHVFLVTPLQSAEHVQAIANIAEAGVIDNPSGAQRFASLHAKHDIHREFGEADLKIAEQTYSQKGSYRRNPAKKTEV